MKNYYFCIVGHGDEFVTICKSATLTDAYDKIAARYPQHRVHAITEAEYDAMVAAAAHQSLSARQARRSNWAKGMKGQDDE